jgi:hypothetical protein
MPACLPAQLDAPLPATVLFNAVPETWEKKSMKHSFKAKTYFWRITLRDRSKI